MPTTNRPFFANFFAAFRQQSALQKASPAITASSTSAAAVGSSSLHTQALQSSSAAAATSTSTPQPISIPAAPKSGQHSASTSASAAVASAAAAAHGAQSHFSASRPLHPPTGTPHNRGHSRPPSPGVNPQFPYSPPSYGAAQQRQRRGSDTSDRSGGAGASGGGAMWPGAEKWYIGGRTAAGEERFYKLGLVKKYDSNDRLSLDRLSL